MTKSMLAATTILLLLGGAAFAQTGNTPSNPVPSQSTASGSGNSASEGTESNSDQPEIASKRVIHRTHRSTEQSNSAAGAENEGPTTTSAPRAAGQSKFPGSGP